MEQERRNHVDFFAINSFSNFGWPLSDVNYAYDDCRFPGPFNSPLSTVNLSTILANPPKAGRPRITLPDGVGSYKTKRAPLPEQTEGSPVEVGDQIGVAMAFRMNFFQPVQVTRRVRISYGIFAGKWWIPHDGIEAGVFTIKNLRKLNLPVKRLYA